MHFHFIFAAGERTARRQIMRHLQDMADTEYLLARPGSERYRLNRAGVLKEATEMIKQQEAPPSSPMRQDLMNTGRILERDDILRLIEELYPVKTKSVEKLIGRIKERPILNDYHSAR